VIGVLAVLPNSRPRRWVQNATTTTTEVTLLPMAKMIPKGRAGGIAR